MAYFSDLTLEKYEYYSEEIGGLDYYFETKNSEQSEQYPSLEEILAKYEESTDQLHRENLAIHYQLDVMVERTMDTALENQILLNNTEKHLDHILQMLQEEQEREQERKNEEMLVKFVEFEDRRLSETEKLVEMIGISFDIEMKNQQLSLLNLEKQVEQISHGLQELQYKIDDGEMMIPSLNTEVFTSDGELDPSDQSDQFEDEIQRCLNREWRADELITDDELDHKAVIKEIEELLNKEPNYTVEIPLSGISGEFSDPYLLPELPMSLSLHAAKILNKWNFTRKKKISKQIIFLVDFIIKIFESVNQIFPTFSSDILKIKRGKGDFDIPFDNG